MEDRKVYELKKVNNQSHVAYGLIDGATEFLQDGVSKNPNPTYINNAAGTVKVLDPSGVAVVIGPAGATSVNAVYVNGSNGDYTFLITSVFDPPAKAGYTIVVDLNAAGGFVGHWELPAVVKVRNSAR